MPGTDDTHDPAVSLELARAALTGESRAVAWFMERLARVPALVRARNARMGSPLNPDEVADTVQDAYAAIWSKLGQFEGRSSFDTWICGFAVHQVRKSVERKYGVRRTADGDTLEMQVIPDPQREESLLDPRVVHDALERLGPPASDVIRLRHFDELPFEEIADRMGVGENTIKARYYRGIARLKELLGAAWRKSVS